jgi:ATP-dependent Lon protease
MVLALIPAKNYARDLSDIPDEVKNALEIRGVSRIEEVLEALLIEP